MDFYEIKVSELFDLTVNTNSSFFTKSFVNEHKGGIPVYSAQKSQELIGYGFIEDNLEGVKYFNDCLTWNIDGSIGKVFNRKGRFSLSEKVIPLILFKKYEGKVDKDYLKYSIESRAIIEGFSFTRKAGKGRIKDIAIKIPLTGKGEFDLNKQKDIAHKYEIIDKINDRIRIMREDMEYTEVSLEDEYKGIEKNIFELFKIKQGDAFYTKKRILENNWIGEIPIYSSNTKEDGILIGIKKEYVKDKDLFYQNCITWSVDGYAGKMFIRNQGNIKNEKMEKYLFTINNHCGIMLPKTEGLFLPFIKVILQHKFFERAKGYGNNKLGNNQISDLTINIPINQRGEFDLNKQKEIANKYEKIEKIKNNLIQELEELEKIKVEI